MALRLTLTAALVLASATASAGALAESSEPLQLAPGSAWTADFAAESCALRRSFTDGTTTVMFEINQVAPGSGVEVAVASSTLKARNRPPRTKFLPGGADDEVLFYRPFTNENGLSGFAVYDTMRPREELRRQDRTSGGSIWPEAARDERERAITGYSVTRAFDRDLVLLTGPMHEPMKVMRACLDDLVTQWGLDPAAQRTLSRTVDVNFDASWVSRVVRLQAKLLDNRSPASVRARLLVDEGGKVTDCRLLNLPADTEDAQKFCAEMEKSAQLTPALDSGGQPVKSFYIWEMTLVMRTQVTTIQTP